MGIGRVRFVSLFFFSEGAVRMFCFFSGTEFSSAFIPGGISTIRGRGIGRRFFVSNFRFSYFSAVMIFNFNFFLERGKFFFGTFFG